MGKTILRKSTGPDAAAVRELVASERIAAGAALVAEGGETTPVELRPVITDELMDWMPPLAQHFAAGVTAFVGSDAGRAARLAADAAAWIGERGRQVTLLDGCIEHPVMAKALPEDGDDGLVDAVLFGVSTTIVARRTLAEGVTLITSGSHPFSIESVFASEKMRSLLAGLSEQGPVLVVLPPSYLRFALHLFDTVLAVADEPAELIALLDGTRRERPLTRLGVIVALKHVAADEEGVAAQPVREEMRAPREPAEATEPGRPESEEAAARRETPEHEEEPQGEEPEREKAATRDAPEPGEVSPEQPAIEAAGAFQEPWARNILASELAGASAVRPVQPPRRVGGRNVRGGRLTGKAAAWIAIAVIISAALVYWSTAGKPGARTSGMEGTREQRVATTPTPEEPQGAGIETRPGAAAAEQETETKSEAAPRLSPEEGAAQTSAVRPEHVAVEGPGGPYRIIISSHKHEADAGTEARELAGAGVATEIIPAHVPDRGTWYRILVAGGYPSWTRAVEVLDTVKSLGYEGAWIEREKQLESEEPGATSGEGQ
jgi:hypothetical protein